MKLLEYKSRWVTFTFLILLISIVPPSYAFALASSQFNGWPSSTPAEQGMDTAKLVEMMEHIKKSNYHTDSILIIRNGHIILDANFYPFTSEQKHNMFSCTKSIMSALIGIAIDKGYIESVKQPIIEFFKEKDIGHLDSHKKSITIEDLLTMTSGLECKDSYQYQWSGLAEMRSSTDWAQHVLDLPMAESPGKRFEYCNGNSLLLSAIIQNATRMKTLNFARKYLFDPLEIIAFDWEASPRSIELGYAGLWLKPHDQAKLGQLYLNKGVWNNKQIVSSKWIELSTKGHIDTQSVQYGYHWWVAKTARHFPWWGTESVRSYEAVGSNGQRISVLPEKQITIVITGSMKGEGTAQYTRELIDSYILPASASHEKIKANEKEQVKLDNLVNDAAMAVSYFWNSSNEGVARDGFFSYTASPEFQFRYPIESHKVETVTESQVMRMEYDVNGFSASIIDIPPGVEAEDFGPVFYANSDFSNNSSNIKVISNSAIKLNCGTNAYRTEIEWQWKKSLPITTYLVSVYKDGKCVFIDAHAWKHHDTFKDLIQSLVFK